MPIDPGTRGVAVLTVLGALAILGPTSRADRPHDVRREALRLYEAGRFDEALPHFDRVLEREPHDIEARNKRGCILLRMNQPARALPDFEEASRFSPFLAYDQIGLLQQFAPDVPLTLSPQAFASGQVYASAVTNQGIALLMLGRDAEARAAFERSITLRLGYPAAYGNPLRRKWQVGLASAYCGLGQVHHRSGNDSLAIESYDQAITYNPDDPNGHLGRGVALAALGRLEESIASYDAALRLDPRNVRALGGRAVALERLGRGADAQADLDAAVRIEPGSADARRLRGAMLSNAGRQADALAEFDAAVALKPGDSGALKDRGAVLSRAGQHDRALKDLDEAIRLDPSNARAFQNRAGTYNELGQFERAIEDCDAALRLDPRNAGARNNRGLALLRLGRYEQAIADLSEAIRLNPTMVPAYVNRGGASSRIGRLDEAVVDYETALRLAPGLPAVAIGLRQVHDLLKLRATPSDDGLAARQPSAESRAAVAEGNARRASGDWSGAVAAFAKAIEADPRNAEAHALRGWSTLCAGLPGGEADARAWLDLKGWREPMAAYMALLGVIEARRAGRDAAATAFLDEALANLPPSTWPAPIFRYLKRTLPSSDLIAQAEGADQLTEARAVIGLDLLGRGERTAARDHLLWVRDHGLERSIAWDAAVEALRRAEAPVAPEH